MQIEKGGKTYTQRKCGRRSYEKHLRVANKQFNDTPIS